MSSTNPETSRRLRELFDPDWLARVETAHDSPMGKMSDLLDMMMKLNTKTTETSLELHNQQVIDGVIPPFVHPSFIGGNPVTLAVKAEITGPEVQKMLDSLPPSIRKGEDDFFEVHQVRLHDLNSLEALMGTTTLLMFYLHSKHEGGECYLFSGDELSHQNWEILQQMYQEHFPQPPEQS
ncbi:MAG: hypothetical protein A2785_02070 [Candidatus Chisholmbacteria bacterium RIFCSPHIGHO2_01_FULL_49_18]|uniref:Uncharacterized protein n=2 Tax=Candidatus Chisholmiibacteriota TaxID=1817900 RepID=A0A1G1VM47_9BACT|nr:MAG: hypothetical protein A2785_02070 [Candidatus Chisholmbacteria bacterium RIFCSPHIGHO2_01_FULL_49_18]OGY22608.1 MAG: hypothetical protein A3A65_05885 [Candidatus Chisholmbacteria bacterium RIFCSPLOWO2_01_FULL_49_14]